MITTLLNTSTRYRYKTKRFRVGIMFPSPLRLLETGASHETNGWDDLERGIFPGQSKKIKISRTSTIS